MLRVQSVLPATGASLKKGKRYTPKRIDAAIALMKRDLANRHHLASKVHAEQPHFHPDTNRADIIIDAQPGAVVKVRVMGAKLSWLPFLRGRQMKKPIPHTTANITVVSGSIHAPASA